jgi:hypothetical protein
LKLTREIFPLLFQIVLVICDSTIDAVPELTPEDASQKKEFGEYVRNFTLEQKKVIDELKELVQKDSAEVTEQQLHALSEKIIEYDSTHV